MFTKVLSNQTRRVRLSNLLTVVVAFFGLAHVVPARAQLSCRQAFERHAIEEVDHNRQIARHFKNVAPDFAPQLLGGVGFKIFETAIGENGRTVLRKREPMFTDMRNETLTLLKTRPKKMSPELQRLVDNLFHPKHVSADTLLIQMPHSNPFSVPIIESGHVNFAFKLSRRMEDLYQRTATWVYQKDGLEPLDPLTSGTMIDEIHNYSFKRRPISYFMLFDAKTWHEQTRFFEEAWQEYLKDPSNTDLDIKFIEPDVFWPDAGVALAIPSEDKSLPVEVKRYFKNEISDPLELLAESPIKDSFTLRNQLLLAALKTLPPEQSLEIHSHTRVHTIAYRKLGFTVAKEIHNPDYPDAHVDLLQAKNSDVIAKITSLLQKRSASSQDHTGK